MEEKTFPKVEGFDRPTKPKAASVEWETAIAERGLLDEIGRIDEIIATTPLPEGLVPPEGYALTNSCDLRARRALALDYLVVCTDVEKLRPFLRMVESLNYRYCLSLEEAKKTILDAVITWC